MDRRINTLLFALLLVSGCDNNQPTVTSLAALANEQLAFNGQQVQVSGTLRTYSPPRHYWIENVDLDRVALAGNKPDDLARQLAPLVGSNITITGRFAYDRDQGRRILVTELQADP